MFFKLNFKRNLTMFGDDTWLKLFPGRFVREDGTTSFFVSDYTEVGWFFSLVQSTSF